jgi:hypothetical protein
VATGYRAFLVGSGGIAARREAIWSCLGVRHFWNWGKSMSHGNAIGHVMNHVARLAVALLLLGAAEARAKDQLLSCSGVNSIQQPHGATQPLSRILSVFAFSNVNDQEPIYIHRIVIFDRNGNKLCDFSKDNPLPAMAFDPPEPFSFEKPLGPYQTLNLPTYALACVPAWLNTSATTMNIMGNLKVVVSWSADPKAKNVIPLFGGVATFVTDYVTGRIDSRDSIECKEIWP